MQFGLAKIAADPSHWKDFKGPKQRKHSRLSHRKSNRTSSFS